MTDDVVTESIQRIHNMIEAFRSNFLKLANDPEGAYVQIKFFNERVPIITQLIEKLRIIASPFQRERLDIITRHIIGAKIIAQEVITECKGQEKCYEKVGQLAAIKHELELAKAA